MPLVLCVPARRFASCQCTTRAMMSARGFAANNSSGSSALAGGRPVERGDFDLHRSARLGPQALLANRPAPPDTAHPPAARASPRRAPAHSRPSHPGTAPLIISSPLSASTAATSRFSVVTRSTPRWPAIFLFLKVLPGSCRLPVEPRLRWLIDTPWLASRPEKFQRFMPPAKPLPLRGAAHIDLLADREMRRRQRGTRLQQRIRRRRGTPPASPSARPSPWRNGRGSACDTFFTLALPQPSCTAL